MNIKAAMVARKSLSGQTALARIFEENPLPSKPLFDLAFGDSPRQRFPHRTATIDGFLGIAMTPETTMISG
jgi:hypothetical protein